MFNGVIVPLELVFTGAMKQWHGVWFDYVDNFIDALFVIDIGLMFITSYLNNKGQEIINYRSIAYNYVTSFRFYTDVFALFGSGWIVMLKP